MFCLPKTAWPPTCLSDLRIYEAIKMLQDVQAAQLEKRRLLAVGMNQS